MHFCLTWRILEIDNMEVGQQITIVVCTPYATTKEDGVIEEISDKGISIFGLEHSLFDKTTGKKTDSFPGSTVYIKEIYSTYINSKAKRRV